MLIDLTNEVDTDESSEETKTSKVEEASPNPRIETTGKAQTGRDKQDLSLFDSTQQELEAAYDYYNVDPTDPFGFNCEDTGKATANIEEGDKSVDSNDSLSEYSFSFLSSHENDGDIDSDDDDDHDDEDNDSDKEDDAKEAEDELNSDVAYSPSSDTISACCVLSHIMMKQIINDQLAVLMNCSAQVQSQSRK